MVHAGVLSAGASLLLACTQPHSGYDPVHYVTAGTHLKANQSEHQISCHVVLPCMGSLRRPAVRSLDGGQEVATYERENLEEGQGSRSRGQRRPAEEVGFFLERACSQLCQLTGGAPLVIYFLRSPLVSQLPIGPWNKAFSLMMYVSAPGGEESAG